MCAYTYAWNTVSNVISSALREWRNDVSSLLLAWRRLSQVQVLKSCWLFQSLDTWSDIVCSKLRNAIDLILDELIIPVAWFEISWIWRASRNEISKTKKGKTSYSQIEKREHVSLFRILQRFLRHETYVAKPDSDAREIWNPPRRKIDDIRSGSEANA